MAKLKFEHSLILPVESIGSFLSLYLSIETMPSESRRVTIMIMAIVGKGDS